MVGVICDELAFYHSSILVQYPGLLEMKKMKGGLPKREKLYTNITPTCMLHGIGGSYLSMAIA